MSSKFKIAVLSGLILMCIASINSAHAYGNSTGRGLVARMLDFASSLLEPAVFELDSDSASSDLPVLSDDASAELGASQAAGGGSGHSALMPFMSFDRLLDEAP